MLVSVRHHYHVCAHLSPVEAAQCSKLIVTLFLIFMAESTETDQQLPTDLFNGFQTEITHDGHNCNGCSLDRRKCSVPDLRALLSSTTLPELDEAYTRRVLGFNSVEEMYQWVSCERLLYQIDDLPMLLVNAADDPCIVEESHCIPKKFVGKLHLQTQTKLTVMAMCRLHKDLRTHYSGPSLIRKVRDQCLFRLVKCSD